MYIGVYNLTFGNNRNPFYKSVKNRPSQHTNGYCHVQTILRQYIHICIDIYYFAYAKYINMEIHVHKISYVNKHLHLLLKTSL